MVRSEVVDVHGIHEVEGPLLVGGVEYLASRIGLFTEQLVLEHLLTDQAFRDYLEFREEVFRKAVREMISTFKSPVDLFFLTDLDRVDFQRQSFNHRTLIQQYNMIVDEESNRSGAVKMSENGVLDEDRIFNKSRKDHISTKLSKARRYYAYRKSLLKLDFIQGNSDPDLVLKLIKKSARWRLDDFELKRGLESHMDLLKEYTSRFGSGCSLSDYENAALERINSEMGSEVEEILYYPNPDEWLMNGYFNRMKLKSLTRDCCLLAENSDITLVKEFMPVPVKEHRTLPSLKQAMKLSVKDWTNNLRGEGAVREAVFKMICKTVGFGKTHCRNKKNTDVESILVISKINLKNGSQCDMKKEELEWQHHQGERVSQRMPHLLREMKNLTKKMRPHFQDDPVGLKLWDNHAKEILYGFEYNLPTALASPTNLPTTVRYQNIMKKKARFMTSGGVDKRLVAAGGVVAVAGVALGLVFRPTSGKQQEAE